MVPLSSKIVKNIVKGKSLKISKGIKMSTPNGPSTNKIMTNPDTRIKRKSLNAVSTGEKKTIQNPLRNITRRNASQTKALLNSKTTA